MGIIIRQSVKSTIWSYLGIVVGYVNVGIIMPQFFDTAQVGLVQLFASVSLIMAQFGSLGFTSVINRMFPVFRDKNRKHNGFLFITFSVGLLGFFLTTAGFLILKPWIIEANIDQSPLFVDYLWLLVPLLIMRVMFPLLDNYNKMLYDTVTGIFWMEFMHKFINLVLIIIFAFKWINFPQFFYGYLVSMSMPVFPLIYVLIRRGEFSLRPKFEFLTKPLRREISTVMMFGFINGLAGVILLNADKVFVNQYLSLNDVGIFGVCSLFAMFIRVPYNSLSKIATGIIAEAWKNDDHAKIKEIYRKSSLNQTILGLLIFVLIMVNLDNIFQILPPAYSSGKWVLIIYSAGMLVNTIVGLAGYITETSKYFRMISLYLLITILVQIGLSVILIPRFGINGAAFVTVFSLVLNASLQAGFQAYHFGIYGLSKNQLYVLGIGIISLVIGWVLPDLPLIPDLIVRSFLVTLVFMGLTLGYKISADLNLLFLQTLNWFRKK